MRVYTLPSREGWRWLDKGWRLFRKQPIALLLFVLSYILLVSLTIKLIPFKLGSPIVALLTPALTFAFFAACRLVDEGVTLTSACLIAGFKKTQPQATRPLLKLGVIYLLCVLLLEGIAHAMGMTQFSKGLGAGAPPTAENAQRMLAIMAVLSILYTPVMMMFWYSPMLVVWHRQPIVKSLFFSFVAVWRNRNAFLAYSIGWILIALGIGLALALVAVIAAALLGSSLSLTLATFMPILIMPILLTFTGCTLYPSYTDVMPLED